MKYRLPDGSTDTPDAEGRHTATVNVMHSAAEFARFPGCEQCRSMVRVQAESDAHVVHGEWWSERDGWTVPGIPVVYDATVAARLDAAVELGYVTRQEASAYRVLGN